MVLSPAIVLLFRHGMYHLLGLHLRATRLLARVPVFRLPPSALTPLQRSGRRDFSLHVTRRSINPTLETISPEAETISSEAWRSSPVANSFLIVPRFE